MKCLVAHQGAPDRTRRATQRPHRSRLDCHVRRNSESGTTEETQRAPGDTCRTVTRVCLQAMRPQSHESSERPRQRRLRRRCAQRKGKGRNSRSRHSHPRTCVHLQRAMPRPPCNRNKAHKRAHASLARSWRAPPSRWHSRGVSLRHRERPEHSAQERDEAIAHPIRGRLHIGMIEQLRRKARAFVGDA